MPAKISVGPPAITISQGSTFMVTDLSGEMSNYGEHGVFFNDTRFLSYYKIYANDQPWVRLTSSFITYYSARIHLTNPLLPTEAGDVPAGVLSLTIGRAVGEGIHEDLSITNYGLTPVRFNLELALRSDFADLFEVKARKFVRRGHTKTVWDRRHQELRTSYDNRDFHRRIIFALKNSDSEADYANGRITFDVSLPPGGSWHTCCYYSLVHDKEVRAPVYPCLDQESETQLNQLQQQWLQSSTTLASSNDDMRRLYMQSVEDMGALRLYDHDFAHDVWLPAAGVPWFVTIFGRDSLIAGLQTLMVQSGLAVGAIQKLAQFQATEMDDWRDAEPGKIPHELRFGELAHFHTVPHTPYYGTADATILYLIALHETWKWLGDEKLLRRYRDVALRCLDWIDLYGDLDNDGFQEYQTRSPQGYENMGWKDSGDAVVYPDGSQVKQPKALCELQGYVFDAWLRMAEAFDALGEADRAADLRRKAAALRERFEERFWCEDIGFYAYTLDPDKRPVQTIASNAGHCLWSGIASPEHARKVMERLMQPDMWSGWGIRTLSADNPAFNPFSYQRGSVWPHDNGIIALGFKRYGFAEEAARIARDILEAATYFVSYRMPELYAGMRREAGTFPVLYLGANVPQAWAAGSVFHLMQAILGLRADAPNKRVYVDPQLPDWLPDVRLGNLNIGSATLELRFWREGSATRWDASVQQGDIDVREDRCQPPFLEEAPDEGVRRHA